MQFFITFAGMKTSQIIMDTSLYTNIPNLFPNFKRSKRWREKSYYKIGPKRTSQPQYH